MTGDRRRLVIIGGAEDKRDDCIVPREFARFRGGTRARIAGLTAATSLPGEVGRDYISVFERLGVETVRAIDTDRRESADRPEHLQIIRESTGVFFTGAHQAKIIRSRWSMNPRRFTTTSIAFSKMNRWRSAG